MRPTGSVWVFALVACAACAPPLLVAVDQGLVVEDEMMFGIRYMPPHLLAVGAMREGQEWRGSLRYWESPWTNPATGARAAWKGQKCMSGWMGAWEELELADRTAIISPLCRCTRAHLNPSDPWNATATPAGAPKYRWYRVEHQADGTQVEILTEWETCASAGIPDIFKVTFADNANYC